ncbi:MAG: gluconate 2-dehydrogenase subunit 3 family protein [bacterium]
MDITRILDDIIKKELDRREFFKWLGRMSIAVSMFGLLDQISCGTVSQPTGQSSLYMQPITDDEKTVYALCDTIIPGSSSDPTGAPGAVDVGTMDFVYDKFYGVVQNLPVILPLINAEANKQYGKPLYELNLEQRTNVLKNVESMLDIIDQIYMFIKGPFYIGIMSRAGLDYMGDPGPNLGYRNDDFSFNQPMSREMTVDGNLP